jgi:hypothetical protein
MMKAVMSGPKYGDRMTKLAHKLIFRARSWRKNMSLISTISMTSSQIAVPSTHLMNMTPPPCATVEKKPLRIRNAMKALNVVAPAQPAAVHNLDNRTSVTLNLCFRIWMTYAVKVNQNKTGSLPKYADKATTKRPPAPSMNTLPT